MTIGSIIHRFRRRFLQGLFDQLYSLGRWLYDPLTRVFFGREWHRWRSTVLPWIEMGATLEIGCGTGEFLDDLASRSGYVVGLDRSNSMLRRARARMRFGRCDLVQGDGVRLPFENDAFQSVVSTFPASYIARSETLDEVARVIKPGGAFLVVASARFTRFQWRRPFIHPILRVAYGSQSSMNRWPDDLLAHPKLPGEWRDLPTEEGEAFVWIARKTPVEHELSPAGGRAHD